jgi:hypothetical protein
MPAFINSPFGRPILLMKGVAAYLWGSFDPRIGNSKLAVSQVVLASNVATVTGTLLEGPAPVVGGLVSIINTTTGAGEFNVSRAAITAVTVSQATGVCAVSFALSDADVTAVADYGTMVCEPAEVPETLVEGASIACVAQAPEGDSQFTVPVSVTFPTMPTDVTVTLQEALVGRDPSEWTDTSAVVTVAASAYTAGPVVEATLKRGYLYRFLVSGLTGSGTILARIGG